MEARGLNEYQAEIDVLTRVRQRHLVTFLAYCIDGYERFLVYEYMRQGTLSQHLFGWQQYGYSPLTWKQRIVIALDVARGIEYLHSLTQQSFIRRDLKPSDILLDDNLRAKVADFGLVRNAPEGQSSVETQVAGTFGYLAPEYAETGRVTTKIDIYAIGVILMELITGRKAIDTSLGEERCHLVTWFRQVMHNEGNIQNEIDHTLNLEEEIMGSIAKVAELAVHCTAQQRHHRPEMGYVVNMLGPLIEQWMPTASLNEDEEETVGIFGQWQEEGTGTSTMYYALDE